MTHFSQQDNFSVAARVLGALFYYAPESAEAAPLVAVLTSDGWETQWPLPEASLAPLVTAFQTHCEETHAQAWHRVFGSEWALAAAPGGSGGSRRARPWRWWAAAIPPRQMPSFSAAWRKK